MFAQEVSPRLNGPGAEAHAAGRFRRPGVFRAGSRPARAIHLTRRRRPAGGLRNRGAGRWFSEGGARTSPARRTPCAGHRFGLAAGGFTEGGGGGRIGEGEPR